LNNFTQDSSFKVSYTLFLVVSTSCSKCF